jgi:hypothetical protein
LVPSARADASAGLRVHYPSKHKHANMILEAHIIEEVFANI